MRLFLLRTSNKFILEALKRQPENLEKSSLLNRTDLLEGYCTAIAFLWQEDKNAINRSTINPSKRVYVMVRWGKDAKDGDR